jgi:hypothetical protein
MDIGMYPWLETSQTAAVSQSELGSYGLGHFQQQLNKDLV